jgi:hypothetical protein
MKPAQLCIAIVLILAVGSSAQQKPEPNAAGNDTHHGEPASAVQSHNGIQSLAWLVGGVWTADASKLGPGMRRIETRYRWADNNAFVRFTTHFVSDKADMHTYDGNFFWDPADKSLAMWYMDAQNEIVQGRVEFDGDKLKMSFRAPDFEGKMADLRVTVTRKNSDDYQWSLQEMQDGSWKDLMTLEYVRTAGS